MDIIKPIIDTNEYKHIILNNKLNVLLVSDKKTKMSSAAMTVNVGYYNDPIDIPGVAHFVEHMLFMGSTKYPNENYYHEYINKSGGVANAQTTEESTTYYFQVLNNYFIDILDIFAHFFIDALFLENSIEREKNAINSEYLKNYGHDGLRIVSVLKDNIDTKQHPYQKFSCGNLKSLSKSNIKTILQDFYNKYYSSNIMHLVILSNKPISEIEMQIINIFQQIPNKNIPIPSQLATIPFTTPKCMKVIPVQNDDAIYVFFTIPNMDKHYKYKPLEYVFYLLSYASDGSMFDILKQKQLCTIIRCDVYDTDTSSYIIGIYVNLTKLGLKNYEYVLMCIDQYIKLIKQNIFQDFIVDEMETLNNINFNYTTNDNKINYVLKLSLNMLKYDIKDVIYGDYIIKNKKPKIKKLVDEILDYVDIKKSIIILESKTFHKLKQKEKWYNVIYDYVDIDFNKILKGEHINFSLPHPNKYIPHNLKLINNTNYTLTKHNNTTYYKNDKFKIPKTYVNITLTNNKFIKSPKHAIIFEMFLTHLQHHNFNKLYYANICNTGYSIYTDVNFITITFYGFNNNINEIIKLFMDTIFTFVDTIDEKMFKYVKYELIEDLENYIYEPLINIAANKIKNMIYTKDYDPNELLKQIYNIKLQDLKKPIKWLNGNCNMKMFIYGNIDNKIINEITNLTKKLDVIINDDIVVNENKINKLNYGETQMFIIKSNNKYDDNNLINMFYEIDVINKNTNIDNNWDVNILCLQFIHLFVKENFFTELRTKEQFGYIVNAKINRYLNDNGNLYGLMFVVQSPYYDPKVIKKRIKKFVTDTLDILKNLKPKTFELYKNNLELMLKRKPTTQSKEFNFILDEILSNECNFEYKKMLANKVKNLDIKCILEFYNKYFINKATRKLRICEIYKHTKQ